MSTFKEELQEFRTPDQLILDTLRATVQTCLLQVTIDQAHMFNNRVYPEGINKLGVDKLKSALSLLQRTIAQNRAGRE